MALEALTSWAYASWRLLEHAEGIYIPSFVYTSFIFYFYLSGFWLEEIFTLLGNLQDDVFLLENIYVIKRVIISKLHRFVIVILILFEHVELERFFRYSRWRTSSRVWSGFFFFLNCRSILFCHPILHHCTNVHKKNLGLLDRQSNLVWSSGGTRTFNKLLVHWCFCCRLDVLNLALEMWLLKTSLKA
jgi:hypothetical protein